MISVNGTEYRTLDQDLYANGKKVTEAYCNGKLVYPEREDMWVTKIVGHIDQIITHSHAGQDPSVTLADGTTKFTYQGGGSYWAKGCFSLVLRTPVNSYVDFRLRFDNAVTTYPAVDFPLNREGISELVFPSGIGIGGGSPITRDGVHPLVGSPEMPTHRVKWGQGKGLSSAELLMNVFVSAPDVCSWTSPSLNFGLGFPYTDVVATPKVGQISAVPSDVNGTRRLHSKDFLESIFTSVGDPEWRVSNGEGFGHFYVTLRSRSSSDVITYLMVHTGNYWNGPKYDIGDGYDIPYEIEGTRGTRQKFERTYRQQFNIINIPVTDLIYQGKELTAPQEHLHPSLDDISAYM